MKDLITTLLFFSISQLFAQTFFLETYVDLREKNHKGYYASEFPLVEALITETKAGNLKPYVYNDKSINDRKIQSIETFMKNLRLPYVDFSKGTKISKTGEADSNVVEEESLPTSSDYYYGYKDLYYITIIDEVKGKQLTRKWLAISIPADHPVNTTGVMNIIAKYDFEEARQVFEKANLSYWEHSLYFGQSLPVFTALNTENQRFISDGYGFYNQQGKMYDYIKQAGSLEHKNMSWINDKRPPLDSNGFFESDLPLMYKYNAWIGTEKDLTSSFSERGNDLSFILFEAVISGRIKTYESNKLNRELTIAEFYDRIKMPDYDESLYDCCSDVFGDEEWYDDEEWFDDDDLFESEEEEQEVSYYSSSDLLPEVFYNLLITGSNKEIEYSPKCIALYLSEYNPNNAYAYHQAMVYFDYRDVKKLLDDQQVIWHNPKNYSQDMPMTQVIEQNIAEYTSLYISSVFGDEKFHGTKENNKWYDPETYDNITTDTFPSLKNLFYPNKPKQIPKKVFSRYINFVNLDKETQLALKIGKYIDSNEVLLYDFFTEQEYSSSTYNINLTSKIVWEDEIIDFNIEGIDSLDYVWVTTKYDQGEFDEEIIDYVNEPKFYTNLYVEEIIDSTNRKSKTKIASICFYVHILYDSLDEEKVIATKLKIPVKEAKKIKGVKRLLNDYKKGKIKKIESFKYDIYMRELEHKYY